MRTFLIATACLALLVPAAALAKGKPANPGSQGKAAPKVMYVLKGTLTAYTPANETANGTVTITVKSANRHGASLKGQTLTFAVSSSTKVVGKFTANDQGMVKLRGPKAGLGDPATFGTLVAKQIIDQHASS
jgi:hypothetical protein